MTAVLDRPTGLGMLDSFELSMPPALDPPPVPPCLDDPDRHLRPNTAASIDGTVCEQSAQRGVVLTTDSPSVGTSMPKCATVMCRPAL